MLYVLDCAQRLTWATSIKNLLFNFGFGYAWIFQEIGNVEAFICEFKQRVKDVMTPPVNLPCCCKLTAPVNHNTY